MMVLGSRLIFTLLSLIYYLILLIFAEKQKKKRGIEKIVSFHLFFNNIFCEFKCFR